MSKSNRVIDTLLPLLLLGTKVRLQRRRFKNVLLASASLTASAMIFTSPLLINDAQAADFSRRIYIGANEGISHLDPDASGIGATVDENNDVGYGLHLGMDISNRISAEIHANVLGTAKLAPTGAIDYQVYGLSALFYGLNSHESRELRENLSGYLRLGVDTMKNTADVPYELESDVSVVLGLGAEYGMSNGLAVRGELTRFYSDAYYVGLGLLYRFGESNYAAGSEQSFEPRAPEPELEPEPIFEEVTFDDEPLQEVESDQDGDGVSDDVDQCLYSTFDEPVNDVGCALFDGVMEGVTFESSSARLTQSAKGVLNDAATNLLNYPGIRVAVMAHTDNSGDARRNLALSKKRVITVVRYLMSQGVPISRMRAEAYGEKRPIASNATAEGRMRNRRVEFKTIQ